MKKSMRIIPFTDKSGVGKTSIAAATALRSARKEILLALRDMLDKTIERAEQTEAKKARKRTKIEVQ